MRPYDFAALCVRAYAETPTIGVADGAVRCLVTHGEQPGSRVFAFRGTDNPATLLTDLDALTVSVEGLGTLHRGIYEAFRESSDALWAALPGGGSYTPTGHSLGAALAIVFGAAGCLFGRPPAAVYAFEPPRVCCGATLQDLFNAHGVPLHLYRNGHDVITQIPPYLEHPAPLEEIGVPSEEVDNLTDHELARVCAALLSQRELAAV